MFAQIPLYACKWMIVLCAVLLWQTLVALKVANKNSKLMNSLQTLRVYDLKGKDIKQMPGTQTEPVLITQGSCPHQTCAGRKQKGHV